MPKAPYHSLHWLGNVNASAVGACDDIEGLLLIATPGEYLYNEARGVARVTALVAAPGVISALSPSTHALVYEFSSVNGVVSRLVHSTADDR
jgi:hypothetical protein